MRKKNPSLKQAGSFSNKQLLLLILPLIVEQFLNILVGVADTAMVSGVGESAVAAVSLVNSMNVFFVQLFTAMCAGGSIVVSQYLGNQDRENACISAHQMLLSTTMLSLIIASIIILFHRQIIGLMDSGKDALLFEQACTYLVITVSSYPFLSINSAGISMMRAMGNTKFSMHISLLANVMNVTGNLILIHPCGLGVAGAAISTLLCRAITAFIVLRTLFQQQRPVHFLHPKSPGFLRLNFSMVKRILRLGIPSGIENSMFELGRLLIVGVVATFPTALRAAHGICNTISPFSYLPNTAISIASITVIGHLIGAGKKEEAMHYGKKLLSWMYISLLPTNLILCFFAEPIVRLFHLSEAAISAASEILTLFGILAIFTYAPAYGLPNILRAAGDARYTMKVCISSMVVVRIGLTYLLVYAFDLSLLGVWIAMHLDWIGRSAGFVIRFCNRKWLEKKAI